MKTFIQRNFNMTVSVICCEERSVKNQMYNFITKEWKEYKAGDVIPDDQFLEIPLNIYDSLVEAIQNDGLAPKPRKEYLEGKLESTESHLKDMRRLAFKK